MPTSTDYYHACVADQASRGPSWASEKSDLTTIPDFSFGYLIHITVGLMIGGSSGKTSCAVWRLASVHPA